MEACRLKQGQVPVWVVNVDPRPVVKAGVSPNTREVTSPTGDLTTGFSILTDVSRFFSDNTPLTLEFSAKIKTNTAGAIVAPADAEDLIDSSNNLVVVGLSPGTAVITITASEPVPDANQNQDPNNPTTPRLGQTATLDVTVTVK